MPQTDDQAFAAAIDAGERAHLLTVGSPARGLCLRITLGRLDRSGRFHDRQPDVFLIWKGKRV
jgi:hypothetical protein